MKTLAQVFSYEVCEISKNTFFTENPWATDSKLYKEYHDLHNYRDQIFPYRAKYLS